MAFKSILFICFVLAMEFEGLVGLTSLHASLEAIPDVVRRGESVALRCLYEMQGKPLYTVKWYRGTREFYRFAPNDIPQQRVFPTPGIYVDLSNSNATEVMLRQLEFNMAGNYSCEVSADKPTFSTYTATMYLGIVSPPESGPVIYAERTQSGPGDILKVNCTAPPSRPPVNLTLIINDRHMANAARYFYDSEGGLQRSELVVSEYINSLHYLKGKISIVCVAFLKPVYLDSASLDFWLSDPRPEKITSMGCSTCLPSGILTIFFLMLATLMYFVDGEDYEDFYNLVFNDYDSSQDAEFNTDYISENIKTSLL